LKEAKELLDKALTLLNEARARLAGVEPDSFSFTPPLHLVPRLRVWSDVTKRGGIVTEAELREIAAKAGYDTRGLGGFFTGKNPSLVMVAGGRVALAAWASNEVERYKAWLEKQNTAPVRGRVFPHTTPVPV